MRGLVVHELVQVSIPALLARSMMPSAAHAGTEHAAFNLGWLAR